MIVVTIMYAFEPDATFDMDYYVNSHLPLVRKLFEPMGMRAMRLSTSPTEGAPGQPTYRAITQLDFDDVASVLAALGEHAAAMQGDLENFSSLRPVTQFGESVAL